MRREIKEQRLLTGASRTRRLRVHNFAPALEDTLQNCDALDVAFETYNRVDVGTSPRPNSGAPISSNAKAATRTIIADIAAQLDALDRQRQRLADLLRDVSL